jgi:hypothetical protein
MIMSGSDRVERSCSLMIMVEHGGGGRAHVAGGAFADP